MLQPPVADQNGGTPIAIVACPLRHRLRTDLELADRNASARKGRSSAGRNSNVVKNSDLVQAALLTCAVDLDAKACGFVVGMLLLRPGIAYVGPLTAWSTWERIQWLYHNSP